MCGIIAIASKKNCIPQILTGLKSLEYRGYDSTGIALKKDNKLYHIKSLGKISNLIEKYNRNKKQSNLCIGHTRWATHGKPSTKNAHPFIRDECALVHNGIIENYEKLIKNFLINKKRIKSETDSEIIAEIFNNILTKFKNPIYVLNNLNKKIEGTYAFAILIKNSNSIYAMKKGSPLLIGIGDNICSLSSDILGLPKKTKKIIFLEENDIAEISHSHYIIYNNGKKVNRKSFNYSINQNNITKNNFKHYMLKEIFQQPTGIKETLLNFTNKKGKLIIFPKSKIKFHKLTNIQLTACGTAYHACMISKYWFEELTNIPVSVDIASEYRYRKSIHSKNTLGIVVSQSGETMDTLKSLRKYKENNIFTASIINVLNSSIAINSDYILPTIVGTEIGVASTKAFTSQLLVLALLSLYLNKKKNNIHEQNELYFSSLFKLPKLIQTVLNNANKINKLIPILHKSKSIFYIGRGSMYPLALEGALKLKEITYKHCEGYAAGELKHGPLALIEKNVPVIALAPYDKYFNKLLSNILEIKARGGEVIAITDNKGAKIISKYTKRIVIMPSTNFITAPIVYSITIQLIAYKLADLMGTDIDQPRNLAKSVTVE